jgi:hypothetical protein
MNRKIFAKRTLATLLIVGLIIAAVFIARKIEDTLAEDRAIAGVECIGGIFRRVENAPNFPSWIAWAWPFKSTDHCWVLFTDGTKVTDVEVKNLACIRHLKQLSLDGTQVTDAGLKDLVSLTELEGLWLGNTQISDVGLKELAVLKQLKELDLWRAHVTDAGVKELEKALPLCKINTKFIGFTCDFGQGVMNAKAE